MAIIEEALSAPIKGRDVALRKFNDTQKGLMLRELRSLERAKGGQNDPTMRDRLVGSVARIYNIIESAIVNPADREFILDEMAAGALELSDLMDAIRAAGASEDEAPAKPVVRRGRSKR